MSSTIVDSSGKFWNHALAFVKSASFKCAIELGIAETIYCHGKPMTVPELAIALSIPHSKTFALGALMDLLTSSGVFTKDDRVESYALTTISRLLVRSDPTSAAPYYLLLLNPDMLNPAMHIGEWFKELGAANPFSLVHGVELWAKANISADLNVLINEAMASDARLVRELVVGGELGRELFGGLRSLVDVGGGTGTMSKAIKKEFPGTECMVLDLQHVVDTVEDTEGVQFIGGDMLQYVPPAEAVLLKWVLHDWNDEDCVTILKNCKDAIPHKKDGGRIIILDMVVGITSDDNISIDSQLFFDIELLLVLPGKERNESEWIQLFQAAGFSDYKIMPYLGARSIIEVYK